MRSAPQVYEGARPVCMYPARAGSVDTKGCLQINTCKWDDRFLLEFTIVGSGAHALAERKAELR